MLVKKIYLTNVKGKINYRQKSKYICNDCLCDILFALKCEDS